ncbi:MAG: MotA/TolQ/ExbB proton channel family protein, partial [Bdellovibrionales bacterium]
MIESIKILMSHGMSGYLIIGAGIFCLIISIERLRYLFFEAAFESSATVSAAKESVLKRKYSEAFQLCSQQAGNPELKVLKEGLLAVENGREAMRSALTGAVLEVSRDCEKRLSFLALIASSATLLGLF